jgi:hypothetical protein
MPVYSDWNRPRRTSNGTTSSMKTSSPDGSTAGMMFEAVSRPVIEPASDRRDDLLGGPGDGTVSSSAAGARSAAGP